MLTRSETLKILDTVVSVLSDIRKILAIVPDYETLLHHVTLFRMFLEDKQKRQQ